MGKLHASYPSYAFKNAELDTLKLIENERVKALWWVEARQNGAAFSGATFGVIHP